MRTPLVAEVAEAALWFEEHQLDVWLDGAALPHSLVKAIGAYRYGRQQARDALAAKG